MLTFYRTEHCEDCDRIEQALHDLVLAHRVIIADREAQKTAGTEVYPLLVDGQDRLTGHRTVLKHIDELEKFKALWDKFQTDACYCDDNGDVE